MRTSRLILLACVATGAFSALAAPALADSIFHRQHAAQAAIPTCSRNLGTVAIREPDHNWWSDLNLASPEVLLKVFVRQSGCFTLVDRGKGFEMAQQERELAQGGTLQRHSNIGRGQVKAADYVLVPDIASKNEHSDGGAIGGILAGLAGTAFGPVGILLGGIGINSKTADVVLSIVDVRTSEDGPIENGHGEKTDISFGGAGFGGGASGFGGAGLSGYTDTTIGQVTTLAYIDAYTKLVTAMGGQPSVPVAQAESSDAAASVPPAKATKDSSETSTAATGALPQDASAAAPAQALTMTKPGHLFKSDTIKSPKVRSLAEGDLLYPTGVRSGDWWQVKDEAGTLGWVNSSVVGLAK